MSAPHDAQKDESGETPWWHPSYKGGAPQAEAPAPTSRPAPSAPETLASSPNLSPSPSPSLSPNLSPKSEAPKAPAPVKSAASDRAAQSSVRDSSPELKAPTRGPRTDRKRDGLSSGSDSDDDLDVPFNYESIETQPRRPARFFEEAPEPKPSARKISSSDRQPLALRSEQPAAPTPSSERKALAPRAEAAPTIDNRPSPESAPHTGDPQPTAAITLAPATATTLLEPSLQINEASRRAIAVELNTASISARLGVRVSIASQDSPGFSETSRAPSQTVAPVKESPAPESPSRSVLDAIPDPSISGRGLASARMRAQAAMDRERAEARAKSQELEALTSSSKELDPVMGTELSPSARRSARSPASSTENKKSQRSRRPSAASARLPLAQSGATTLGSSALESQRLPQSFAEDPFERSLSRFEGPRSTTAGRSRLLDLLLIAFMLVLAAMTFYLIARA